MRLQTDSILEHDIELGQELLNEARGDRFEHHDGNLNEFVGIESQSAKDSSVTDEQPKPEHNETHVKMIPVEKVMGKSNAMEVQLKPLQGLIPNQTSSGGAKHVLEPPTTWTAPTSDLSTDAEGGSKMTTTMAKATTSSSDNPRLPTTSSLGNPPQIHSNATTQATTKEAPNQMTTKVTPTSATTKTASTTAKATTATTVEFTEPSPSTESQTTPPTS